jgi:hypothetical protein
MQEMLLNIPERFASRWARQGPLCHSLAEGGICHGQW